MKRLAVVVGSALSYWVVSTATALANSTGNRPGDEPVQGTVVNPPSGTAFTGADLGIWLAVIAALVVVGAVLLLVGRRRAASIS